MEVKKSNKADLESGRTQRFLLGLVLALACLYVGFEYNVVPEDPLEDPDLLEMLSNEAELAPLNRQQDMVSLAPQVEPPPTTQLKIAEEEPAEVQQEEEPLESDTGDDLPSVEDEELQKEEEPEVKDLNDDPLNFRVVEDLPKFPGGPIELMKWLTRNLKYPNAARNARQQGRVIAEFIVEKDGSLTNFKIVQSLCPSCDNEALRVLQMMPRWTAGVQNDQPCRTKVCIPIVFKL